MSFTEAAIWVKGQLEQGGHDRGDREPESLLEDEIYFVLPLGHAPQTCLLRMKTCGSCVYVCVLLNGQLFLHLKKPGHADFN